MEIYVVYLEKPCPDPYYGPYQECLFYTIDEMHARKWCHRYNCIRKDKITDIETAGEYITDGLTDSICYTYGDAGYFSLDHHQSVTILRMPGVS